jgi:hypothetical protein
MSNVIKNHEAEYICSRGIEESLFSKNAYVPKQIEVGGNNYAFYLNREEGYIEVFTVFGDKKNPSRWKVSL